MKKFFLLGALIALSACKDFGPYQVSLRPSQSFSLKNTKGSFITIDHAQNYEALISLIGTSKSIFLKVGEDQFEFKNATVDAEAQSAMSLFDVSGQSTSDGQRAGISFDRNPICNPDCVEVQEFEATQRCSYHPGESERVCEIGPDGRRRCRTEWHEGTVFGSQRVLVKLTISRFEVTGDVVAEKWGHLAQARGVETVEDRQFTPLTRCR